MAFDMEILKHCRQPDRRLGNKRPIDLGSVLGNALSMVTDIF